MDPNPIHAVLLGLVQGITEWLPVSSSGHLVIVQKYFGLDVPLFFDLALHVATVIVIIVAFRNDIVEILRSIVTTFRLRKEGKSFRDILSEEKSALMAWFIVLGSIPTAIVGFILRSQDIFSNLTIVGAGLLATGAILSLTVMARRRKEFLRSSDALLMGAMQGLSIVPGISRSGSMISLGMLNGVERELTARFVFLLSIPAILGAATFELFEVMENQVFIDPQLLAIAFISSLLFGYISIKLLWFIVKHAKLHYFSIYCFVLGSILLANALL
jgi:undecaprenyl-diphosphatase